MPHDLNMLSLRQTHSSSPEPLFLFLTGLLTHFKGIYVIKLGKIKSTVTVNDSLVLLKITFTTSVDLNENIFFSKQSVIVEVSPLEVSGANVRSLAELHSFPSDLLN